MVRLTEIDSLADFFYNLFRSEEGKEAIIQGQGRLVRENYFLLFFPKRLCDQYIDKSKSNLTWFFSNDKENKAIKRTLIHMLEETPQLCINEVHQKCHDLLWPQGTHASFNRDALRSILLKTRFYSKLNQVYHISKSLTQNESSLVDKFYDIDPSAALARVVLTLAIQSESDKLLEEKSDIFSDIWNTTIQDALDCMRRDKTIDGQIRYYRMLDFEGRKTDAYSGYQEIAKKLGRKAQSIEESRMYDRMGEMLCVGEGHFANEQEAIHFFELGCFDENPISYYIYSSHLEGKAAQNAIEKAAKLGCPPAYRELGNAYFTGKSRLGFAQNYERAKAYYRAGMSDNSEDGIYCAYMLGRVYEAENELDAAISAYRTAADYGVEDASERLTQLNLYNSEELQKIDNQEDFIEQTLSYCIINDVTGANKYILNSLHGKWTILEGSKNFIENLSILLHDNYSTDIDTFSPLLISLLSDDYSENLELAIEVIGFLNKSARSLGMRCWDFINVIDLYVAGNHDVASSILDTALDSMGQLYLRVHLCDYGKDAADDLFSHAPLFQPILVNEEDKRIRLVIIGTTSTALDILSRAIALPMPTNVQLSINIFGPNANNMKDLFLQRCPGIDTASPAINRIRPQFWDMNYEGEIAKALRAIRGKQVEETNLDESLDNTIQRLAFGNYYVVATGQEERDIEIATLLRRELIKNSPSFDNTPLIAVNIRNPIIGKLVFNLSSGSTQNTTIKYRHHDLFPFGMMSMYAYPQLMRNTMEKRAQKIHLFYAGDPEDNKERHVALACYYKKQYNRDSSRITSLSLIYRVFQAGIHLPAWQLYGTPEEVHLGSAYTAWLEKDNNLKEAARLEHERWNSMMLSLGWEQASSAQTAAYVQHGNPGHQMYMGKMHPFISEWSTFDDGSIVEDVREIISSRYPEKKVQDPREADIVAVKITENLLSN